MTAEQMLADQARVFSDFPTEEVTIGPTSYQCLVMESREGTDMGLGGYANEDYHRIALERGTVLAMPQEDMTATLRGRVYSVIRIERDDAAASIVIDLASRVSGQQS